jgi:hypothetical protein
MFKPKTFHLILFSDKKAEPPALAKQDHLINNKYFSQSVVNLRLEKSFNSRLFRF